ncbi:signal peptidase II [Paenibacillus segetis]|uniref:Peptidase A8 n=1 Tax=Paenibacillus segetis TaxID=1325360 RepID=A0ABQ1Y1S1_9BACL|nr:signal peptidase II [Paenibacillus segetis]GGH09416.1 peptidase A8 [Paenibacillus segetis]
MKKQWLIAGLLIALDQLVKIFIWNFALEKRLIFIPNVMRFEPFQNTNLNWFASMANIVMPIFFMVVFQLSAAIAVTLFYRYQRYTSEKTNLWLSLGFCMALAGIGCSFLDVVLWGGSLDYIGLFDWYIFDMKDVFLNAGWISILIWFNSKAYKSRKNESISFKTWMSNGCKLS